MLLRDYFDLRSKKIDSAYTVAFFSATLISALKKRNGQKNSVLSFDEITKKIIATRCNDKEAWRALIKLQQSYLQWQSGLITNHSEINQVITEIRASTKIILNSLKQAEIGVSLEINNS